MPNTITIIVLGINEDGETLDLAIGVNSGDTVIWQVEDNSNVRSIDLIKDLSETIQIFDDGGPSNYPPANPPNPPVRGKSKKWGGKISKIGTRVIESYCIYYTRDSDGAQNTHDPKIIANP